MTSRGTFNTDSLPLPGSSSDTIQDDLDFAISVQKTVSAFASALYLGHSVMNIWFAVSFPPDFPGA